LIVWQFEVPGEQTVTLTHGLLGYEKEPLEQSEPFTVTRRTFDAPPLPPETTVRLVVPEMYPALGFVTAMTAVTVVVPAVIAAAVPLLPAVLPMVATPVLEEFQVANDVRSCVVPSENVPIALNCRVPPTAILASAGWSASELSVAEETFKVVEAVTFPDAATTVVVPAATAVASPMLPAVLPMVATAVLEELQVTDEVISFVVPSEKVPMALNCWEVSMAIAGLSGWSVIFTSEMTVKMVEAETFPNIAVICAEPAATAVAAPTLPAVLLMVATAALAELQVTDEVKFCVVPSENVPVAVNC